MTYVATVSKCTAKVNGIRAVVLSKFNDIRGPIEHISACQLIKHTQYTYRAAKGGTLRIKIYAEVQRTGESGAGPTTGINKPIKGLEQLHEGTSLAYRPRGPNTGSK